MRTFVILALFISGFVQAQTVDVNAAYERETKFLEEQRQSLLTWKARLKKDGEAKRSSGEAELKRLNLELASLTVRNQSEQEGVQRWEKLLKDAATSGPQLEKNLLRLEALLRELREKTPLADPTMIAAGTAPLEAFRIRLEDGINVLHALGQPALRSHAFLDTNGRLTRGEVLSLGLFGAFGVQGQETYLLAPYDRQWLQATEKLVGDELLLFDPTFQRAGLKTHAGWKEKAADAAPGLVMVLIMMTVVALFVALARA